MPRPSNDVLDLQRFPGGVAAGLRSRLCSGRYEIVSVGADPALSFVGSDPWNTNVNTGLQVPTAPTSTVGGRYLFQLARVQFNSAEVGVRLTGIRQYAELAASVTSEGVTYPFRREIVDPLFHPPDGNISWHVMVIPKTQMARRNVQNADTVIFRDSYGPALLYETIVIPPGSLYPGLTAYAPSNGGRPWGRPIGASLGNIHDLRYRWRYSQLEEMLDIPIPLPCDVALFASVRQNNTSLNPAASILTANQFSALSPEEQFLTAYSATAQYGRIAGSLVFSENLGEDVP